MSETYSIATRRRYPVVMVARCWRLSRSWLYAKSKRPAEGPPSRQRPGPRPRLSDRELTAEVRKVIEESPFVGEGYRKVTNRLKQKGIPGSKHRVLRLMREADLLAPQRPGNPRGPRAHDGKIVTDRPDEMWGTDMTTCWLTSGSLASVFITVDHCTSECLGIHASLSAIRFEALEPVRQAVRECLGPPDQDVAAGVVLRHDHGSQYMSEDFQAEIGFLGLESSPAYVREPEGNGCAERFIRTLKEQLLWLQPFHSIEALQRALQDFKNLYNRTWIVQRHGYLTPSQVRALHGLQEAA